MMGFFSNNDGEEGYRKAAQAVEAGVATTEQETLNAKAAQQAGPFGDRARAAYK